MFSEARKIHLKGLGYCRCQQGAPGVEGAGFGIVKCLSCLSRVLSFAFSCKQGEQVDCLYTSAVWRMFSKEETKTGIHV